MESNTQDLNWTNISPFIAQLLVRWEEKNNTNSDLATNPLSIESIRSRSPSKPPESFLGILSHVLSSESDSLTREECQLRSLLEEFAANDSLSEYIDSISDSSEKEEERNALLKAIAIEKDEISSMENTITGLESVNYEGTGIENEALENEIKLERDHIKLKKELLNVYKMSTIALESIQGFQVRAERTLPESNHREVSLIFDTENIFKALLNLNHEILELTCITCSVSSPAVDLESIKDLAICSAGQSHALCVAAREIRNILNSSKK